MLPLDYLAADEVGPRLKAGGVNCDGRARLPRADTWARPMKDDVLMPVQMIRFAGYGQQLSGQYIQGRSHAGQRDRQRRTDCSKTENNTSADAKRIQFYGAQQGI